MVTSEFLMINTLQWSGGGERQCTNNTTAVHSDVVHEIT